MAETFKVLGQSAPSATTPASLYTVPSATQAVVSTISICNRSSSSATYRVSIRPSGASQADIHYFAYDAVIPGNTTDTVTAGITLSATDVITVYSSNGSISFQAFGSEITA